MNRKSVLELETEVNVVLGRITLAPWYRDAAFAIETNRNYGTDWAPIRIRLEYMEPDTESGVPTLQCGRWWYIEREMDAEAILKTAWAALTMSDEHRRREGFMHNGHRIFDPHKKVIIPGVNA